MKIREVLLTPNLFVQYFDIQIYIPAKCKFIASDKTGLVYAYIKEPKLDITCWLSGPRNESFLVADVELEGVKWSESLVKI